MAYKKIIYTHDFPYHIVARCNNHEFFPIPLSEVWTIFQKHLAIAHTHFSLRIHGFLLMSNHYHMIASTSDDRYLLGHVMNRLQTQVSKAINLPAGRKNHLFGGTYKPTLIETPHYYFHAMKYLYQNPIRAKMCGNVLDYPYNNLKSFLACNGIDQFNSTTYCEPNNSIANPFNKMTSSEIIRELNTYYSDEQNLVLKNAIRRKTFKMSVNERIQTLNWV